MNNPELDAFIAQKRTEGQSDEMILQELVTAGWEKAMVLAALAGGNIPQPAVITPVAPVTSQTSGAGQPVQVENIQYNVKVDKVRSKTGLASMVSGLMAWMIAIVGMFILLIVRQAILPDAGEASSDLLEMIVFGVAVLVPVLPIGIFATKRLNRALAENPAAIDDIFFKRSIRWNLILSLFVAGLWAIVFVYNLLAIIVLGDENVTRGMTLDSFLFFAPFMGLVYFFWTYQRQTKR